MSGIVAVRMRLLELLPLVFLIGCSSSSPKICGPNTLRDGDTCVPNPSCGPGTRIQGGLCVADAPPTLACGAGTHRAGTECVPDLAGTSSTSTTSWSANVRVSEMDLDFAAETAMAVDSKGNIVIAAMIFPHYDPRTFDDGIGVWRSTDGGATFARIFTATHPAGKFVGDPTVVFDAEDRLIVGWVLYADNSSASDVMVVHSTDGATFGMPELVDPDRVGDFRDRPWLALAPDGSVSINWVAASASAPGTGARRAISRDGGAFQEVETVEPGDQGQLVNSPIAFAKDGTGMAIGDAFMTWRLTDGGWSSGQAIAPPMSSGEVSPTPIVAWSEAAGFDVIFLGLPRYDVSLYTTHTVDRGRSWTAPSALEGDEDAKSSAVLPWITADERGRIHVIWLDNRGGGWAPYTAFSDDGVHFHAVERIGDATFDENGDERRWIGDFLAIVARGGKRYATWSDSRDGSSAIYFSSAPGVP
jgi:hypothetical protein